MSFAAEIKRKNRLQTELQASLQSTNDLVSSWLRQGAKPAAQAADSNSSEFFKLPIVPSNSTLSLSATAHRTADSIDTAVSIGDYVHLGKSIKKHAKHDKQHQHSKVVKDTKALHSLRNKLKTSSRGKAQQQVTAQRKQAPDSDSDSEDDRRNISRKKQPNLLIKSKK